MYLAGRALVQTNLGNLRLRTGGALRVGGRDVPADSTSFEGVIDELAIYNRALTPAELEEIVLADSAGRCLTGVPPEFARQPESATALVGHSTNLVAFATGSGPLNWSWFFNGAKLPGATNRILTLTNLTLEDTGGYYARVENAFGVAATSVAIITVKEAPALVNGGFETGNFSGWIVSDVANPVLPLSVRASGFNPGQGFFVTRPTEGRFAATHGFDGPGQSTIRLAQDVRMPSGLPALSFDWRAGWNMMNFGVALYPRTFRVLIEPVGGGNPLESFFVMSASPGTKTNDTGPVTTAFILPTYAGEFVRVIFEARVPEAWSGPGFFQLDNVALENARRPVAAPLPSLARAVPGGTLTLSASVTGTPPLAYQWQFDGVDIPNESNAALTLTNIQAKNAGKYSVNITNVVGQTSSSTAQVKVNSRGFLDPTLIRQGNGIIVSFTAPIGGFYTLLASTNLVNWEIVGTVKGDALGNGLILDTNALNSFQRFYRIRVE